MTGWRIGYGAEPRAPIEVMAGAQSRAASCPSSSSQTAAVMSGSRFGLALFLRMSRATAEANLREACERIAAAAARLDA